MASNLKKVSEYLEIENKIFFVTKKFNFGDFDRNFKVIESAYKKHAQAMRFSSNN